MTRLHRVLPADMTPEQREIYDKFAGGRRADPASGFSLIHQDGGLIGPPNLWLFSPPVAKALELLGGVVRFELGLERPAHELAILVVATAHASAFELATHVPAARAAGLTDDQLAAVVDGRVPEGLTQEQGMVHEVATTLVSRRGLDDALYARAVDGLGERLLLELVTLVGYYELVALQLAVFGGGGAPHD